MVKYGKYVTLMSATDRQPGVPDPEKMTPEELYQKRIVIPRIVHEVNNKMGPITLMLSMIKGLFMDAGKEDIQFEIILMYWDCFKKRIENLRKGHDSDEHIEMMKVYCKLLEDALKNFGGLPEIPKKNIDVNDLREMMITNLQEIPKICDRMENLNILKQEWFDLSDCLEKRLQHVKNELSQSEQPPVNFRLSKGTPVEVFTDPEFLNEIIDNLLLNAIKNGKTQKIDIVCDVKNDETFEIRVRDYGKGFEFDPSVLGKGERISTAEQPEDHGHGTDVSAEMIKNMGFAIRFENNDHLDPENPVGASVTITVPEAHFRRKTSSEETRMPLAA